jgi:hypothetical protein
MSLLGVIQFLRDRLNVVVWVCCVGLAALVAADIARLSGGRGQAGHGQPSAAGEHPESVAGAGHVEAAGTAAHAPHGFWAAAHRLAETAPGFWAAFGLLGCLLLVIVSKSYGRAGISVGEDYYDR